MTDSRIWGPNAWYFIHSAAFALPLKEKLDLTTRKRIISFYSALLPLLPCPHCKEHYASSLRKMPIAKYVETGTQTSAWTVRIHNLANRGLKKPVFTYPQGKKLFLNKPIYHSKIQSFFDIIAVASKSKPISKRLAVAVGVINLYPCKLCKPYLVNFLKKNPIKPLNTPLRVTKWARKLSAVIRTASIEAHKKPVPPATVQSKIPVIIQQAAAKTEAAKKEAEKEAEKGTESESAVEQPLPENKPEEETNSKEQPPVNVT